MEITLNIPQQIIALCEQSDFNEHQTKTIFKNFLAEIINDQYGQFAIDFDNYLQEVDLEREEEQL